MTPWSELFVEVPTDSGIAIFVGVGRTLFCGGLLVAVSLWMSALLCFAVSPAGMAVLWPVVQAEEVGRCA